MIVRPKVYERFLPYEGKAFRSVTVRSVYTGKETEYRGLVTAIHVRFIKGRMPIFTLSIPGNPPERIYSAAHSVMVDGMSI